MARVSGLWHPIGPERASVYWRRRIVLLAFVAGVPLLALVVVNAFGQPGAGSLGAGPSANASGSASSADPSRSSVPTNTEPMECADDAIEVSADTDASTYRVGEGAVLTLRITNTSGAPCLRDIGPKANELEITSGGYQVW